MNSLAELISPMAESDFSNHFLNKAFAHIRSGNRRRLEHVLPWRVLNALLQQNSFHVDGLRVMRDGRTVPGMLYRKDSKPEYLDGAKLKSLCAQGTSIVINHIQTLVPEIGWLAQFCELAFGEKVNINAYLSLERGGAFAMHYDAHDVLVLQIHGSKRWQLFDEPELFPLHEGRKSPASGRNVVFDEVIEAGDILYVPRGVYHRAEVDDEHSLHLALGVNTRKGVDFAQWLRDQLASDPLFRQDLPLMGGEEHLSAYGRQLKTRLSDMLEKVSIRDFLAQTDARRAALVNFDLGPKHSVEDTDMLRVLVRRNLGSNDADIAARHPALVDTLAMQAIRILMDRLSMSFSALKAAMPANAQTDSLGQVVDMLAEKGLIAISPAHSTSGDQRQDADHA
jgi:ribosomal protein L16 Arg81 hydroxylase